MKRNASASSQPDSPTRLVAGLAQRLHAAAHAVLPAGHADRASEHSEPAPQAGFLISALTDFAAAPDRGPERWLLFVAVHGRFPTTAEYQALVRLFDLEPHERVATTLLQDALGSGATFLEHGMRVVTDATVVEVSYSAQSDHHTGIQRVVRETVPRWAAAGHTLVPVAWDVAQEAMRTITETEHRRVFAFDDAAPDQGSGNDASTTELVVPFRTDVVFADVPVTGRAAEVAACLARFSGNRVGHVGYDLIPFTSADLRPEGEAVGTAALFSVMKHSARVACISSSATTEIAGMVATLPTQGLTGPEVREVALPAIASPLPPGPAAQRRSARPVVLLTGTREPHKNHRAVLFAAERLWREGLDFEVRQVGGRGWNDDAFADAARRLTRAGKALTVLGRVSEQRLWDELRAADVVVFISLHEGYGLPVAEALSVGTPVITTRYGSQAEVAADGGCLLVDPRDDDDVTSALRRLITDADLRARLAAEAKERPVRTWDDYARDLWDYLVGTDVLAAGATASTLTEARS